MADQLPKRLQLPGWPRVLQKKNPEKGGTRPRKRIKRWTKREEPRRRLPDSSSSSDTVGPSETAAAGRKKGNRGRSRRGKGGAAKQHFSIEDQPRRPPLELPLPILIGPEKKVSERQEERKEKLRRGEKERILSVGRPRSPPPLAGVGGGGGRRSFGLPLSGKKNIRWSVPPSSSIPVAVGRCLSSRRPMGGREDCTVFFPLLFPQSKSSPDRRRRRRRGRRRWRRRFRPSFLPSSSSPPSSAIYFPLPASSPFLQPRSGGFPLRNRRLSQAVTNMIAGQSDGRGSPRRVPK